MCSSIKNHFVFAWVFTVLLGFTELFALTGVHIPYSGELRDASGLPVTGLKNMKFALISQNGTTTYWSNDGSGVGQAASIPTNAVQVNVDNGIFSVYLGDTSVTNMTALFPHVFESRDVYLRVWVENNSGTFEAMQPDKRMSAVPFAFASYSVIGSTPKGRFSDLGLLTSTGNEILFPHNLGQSGQYLSYNGQGQLVWTNPATAGANESLSNLNNVAINAHLLPDTTNTKDLGSSTKKFSNLYMSGVARMQDLVSGTGHFSSNVSLESSIYPSFGISNSDLGATWSKFRNLYMTGIANVGALSAGNATIAGLSYPGADGSNGQVLQTDGNGNLSWTTVSASGNGADTSLSNLSNVAINTDLLPNHFGAIDLGSTSKRFLNLYLARHAYMDDLNAMNGSFSANVDVTGLFNAGNATLGGLTYPVSDGTSGQVLQTNGSGNLSWVTISASGNGADTSLNNLSNVAVNTDLLPDTSGTRDLGSSSKKFSNLHLTNDAFVKNLSASSNVVLSGTLVASNAVVAGLSYPSSDGSNGQVLQTNGSGSLTWATVAGSSGANISLDNLSSVAINTHLTPGTNGTIDLGTGQLKFKNMHMDGTAYMNVVWGSSMQATNLVSTEARTSTLIVNSLTDLTNSETIWLGKDTVTLTGNIMTETGEAVDIGSSSNQIRDIHVDGTANIDNLLADAATIAGLNYPSSDGTSGQVLQTNGNGVLSWTTISGSGNGANTSLSNLSSTAINADLLPMHTGSKDLGSSSKRFLNLYLSRHAYMDDLNAMNGAFSANVDVTGLFSAGNATLGGLSYPVTDGTSGQVLQTNGSGNLSWATISGNGADTSLSNLSSTAINADLLPMHTGSKDLGSSSKRFLNLYLSRHAYMDDLNAMNGAFSANVDVTGLFSASNATLGGLSYPVTDGTSGQVLQTNGSGNLSWVTPSGNGADTSLSNLSSTAINADLLPMHTGSKDLGSSSKRFLNLYLSRHAYMDDLNAMNGAFSANVDVTGLFSAGNATLGGLSYPVTDGTSGQVLQTNGSGNLSWVTPSGNGANTSLSNLSSTAINADLLPMHTGSKDLGSSSKRFLNLYLSRHAYMDDLNAMNGAFSANVDVTGLFNAGNATLGGLSYPVTDGTNGQVLQTNGSGNLSWTTIASGGANTSLNNLSNVAVNTHITPDSHGVVDLGSSGNRFRSIYAQSVGYIEHLVSQSGSFAMDVTFSANALAGFGVKSDLGSSIQPFNDFYLSGTGNIGDPVKSDRNTSLVITGNSLFDAPGIVINDLGSGNSIKADSGAVLTATGTWTNASDKNRKKNIKNLDYGIEEVMKLRPVRYEWKKNSNRDIGFVAQEVRKVIPEVVFGNDGNMSMSYAHLTSILVNAVQQQNKMLDKYEHELKVQRKVITRTMNRLQELEKAMSKDQNSER